MPSTVPVNAAPLPGAETLSDARTASQRLWCTVVHDDPVNTMDYVTWVFHSYFGFPIPLARRRMLEVHTTGRAVVSRGARERMEVDVTAMHSYGLHATIEPLADDGPDSPQADGPTGGQA
ncbi:ATP-dependent Clp protease adapter ClpS [Actinomyces sp. MRS3W]|uniref:ATP-dependent Clp protease adapter ClpS n=1 Tax=Actinomyces sp. MRS3W TaxID=2800796 RepID=UPI0028FD6988|nr:ATP-dependent Clp protease adapter ClpS [Actinomyces sp. MRS3W]MDU0348534.1 ATP-dependent Clp protease adapter ClpS [Actinomyces sp. MRS3W]